MVKIQRPIDPNCIVKKGCYYRFLCTHCNREYRARKYRTGNKDVWKYECKGHNLEADVAENLQDWYADEKNFSSIK
jgi:hypothetical protein